MESGKLKRYDLTGDCGGDSGCCQSYIGEQTKGDFYLASEVDALMPRERAAETIGEAPDGEYRRAEKINGEWDWDRWRPATKDECLKLLRQVPGAVTYMKFFGPLPQPPKEQP